VVEVVAEHSGESGHPFRLIPDTVPDGTGGGWASPLSCSVVVLLDGRTSMALVGSDDEAFGEGTAGVPGSFSPAGRGRMTRCPCASLALRRRSRWVGGGRPRLRAGGGAGPPPSSVIGGSSPVTMADLPAATPRSMAATGCQRVTSRLP
jgi:hypothetical protein